MAIENEIWPNFWVWLVRGYGERPGYKLLFTKALFFDFGFALVFSYLLAGDVAPWAPGFSSLFATVFLGLAISSSATGITFIATQEIGDLAKLTKGGVTDYLFPLFAPMVIVPLPYLGWQFWDQLQSDVLLVSVAENRLNFFLADFLSFFLFSLSFLALRTAWKGYLAPAHLVIAIIKLKNAKEEK